MENLKLAKIRFRRTTAVKIVHCWLVRKGNRPTLRYTKTINIQPTESIELLFDIL